MVGVGKRERAELRMLGIRFLERFVDQVLGRGERLVDRACAHRSQEHIAGQKLRIQLRESSPRSGGASVIGA
ncbi:hypothetical protein GON01_03770 [Sphingomonas sp. MAH-20]|jgi:hypothetical protein|uniref:Uncharacterized protein n=1 Tax=Sphingomonas horti TaxID=2682842 RepID=A0A6I4IY58_9SPHN|nr:MULTISPECIES: hypothetical protein [Sphingomonas]MBA2918086.1 hypothetical protein [Sphingomonas sp. CGMCC 1.13658]MVO77057.1 hypothetical protein [Sphingomonas horti]